ncbi:MAG: hypothetical protein P1U63_07250 [Coxiellaceae bacterium]|nr:hypothetical protein [Coxiellaceae bacterium]
MIKKTICLLTMGLGFFIVGEGLAKPNVELLSSRVMPDKSVSVMVEDKANNAMYIAGQFTGIYLKTGGAAVFTAGGKLVDHSSTILGKVYDSVSDGNGGFYIGGDFTDINATGQRYIAHIHSDGSLDQQFLPVIASQVKHLAVMNDKLYVATDRSVHQINLTTGLVNPLFSVNTNNLIYAMHATSHALYIGGIFHGVNGSRFEKLDLETGAVDSNYYHTISAIKTIASSQSGALYLAGYMHHIVKLDEITGAVDKDFNVSLPTVPTIITMDGDWLYLSIIRAPYVRRYNAVTGEQDVSFSVQARYAPSTIQFNDHYMYMTGNFSALNPNVNAEQIARFDRSSFERDRAYFPHVDSRIMTASLSGDELFVGGWFKTAGQNMAQPHVAKINLVTGLPDATFKPAVGGVVYALALNGDDIYVGGRFSRINGQAIHNMAKLSKVTGDVDKTFKPNPNSTVYKLATYQGYLYVGGFFRVISGRSGTPRLARYKLDDLVYDAKYNLALTNAVWTMAFADSAIYVGGNYPNRLSKYDLLSGNKDALFSPQVDGTVKDVLVDGDNIYVAGYFAQGPLKLNRFTGVEDAQFNVGELTPTRIFSLAKRNDYIYIGADKIMQRLSQVDGSIDTTFNPNPDGLVYTMLFDGDVLYEAGHYQQIMGDLQSYWSAINVN